MKLVSAMVFALTLAGCASSSQPSQQLAQAQTDEQKCRTGTPKPGTPEYDKCRAIFDAARKGPSSYWRHGAITAFSHVAICAVPSV